MDLLLLAKTVILGAIFAAPALMAQSSASQSPPSLLLSARETPRTDPPTPFPPRRSETLLLQPAPIPPVKFSNAKFIFLSASVYAASFADMHQTMAMRHNSWWYETDPLARPFARLPAPAYYATGLAMATGVNWLSWKMSHSRRWHKFAPIPQLLAISGNLYGFRSNLH
jgi:hypothetical protein